MLVDGLRQPLQRHGGPLVNEERMHGDHRRHILGRRARRRLFGAAAVVTIGLTGVVMPRAGWAQGILQSTYLGGQGRTEGRAVAVNPSNGNIFVAGAVTIPDIPGGGGVQPEFGGVQDGFAVYFGPLLRTLPRATYLGDSAAEQIDALIVDPETCWSPVTRRPAVFPAPRAAPSRTWPARAMPSWRG
jgi:hypothetical protein